MLPEGTGDVSGSILRGEAATRENRENLEDPRGKLSA